MTDQHIQRQRPPKDVLDLAHARREARADRDVVWTSVRLGHAAALNAGIRRASGAVVILLDSSVEPLGDFVAPLTGALDDPGVAVTGPWGLRSGDLRHFAEAAAGDVDAI